ncbi:MAG: hypothetical protein K8T90_14745 [Planctomycetes bacterium]|nr:hypothetical protein [Planctomycetota bacterium]
MARGDLELQSLEIEEAGVLRRVEVRLRALPASGPVVATFDGPGAREVLIPPTALPTVREGWLIFDDLRGERDGLSPAEAAAIAAWRASPRAGQSDAAFEPLTWSPGPDAFRAAAAVAAGAPRLPRDVALALLLAAAAEVSLLALAARRRPAVRAIWLAGPPLAALIWLVSAGRLPGDVRAVTFRLDGPSRRLLIVRFDSPRGGEVSFRVPDDATAPAILRYDEDDVSAVNASAGREVVLPIPAGQSRVVAWSVPVAAATGPDDVPGPAGDTEPQPDARTSWLGLRATGVAAPARDDPFLRRRGFRPVEGAAFTVIPTVRPTPAERK